MVFLLKTKAIQIFLSGNKAIKEIEGLKSLLLRGIFFNYLIFFSLTLIFNGLFYFKILSPIIHWIFGIDDSFWASFGNFVLWSIQLTISAIITLTTLRFSVEFMGFWNQNLVNKIIQNFRNIEEKNITLKAFLNEIKYFVKEALKACLFPILLLLFGLIPFLGLPIVFLFESHLIGRQCIMIYLESFSDPEEIAMLKKRWRWLPIKLGFIPTILTFIPLVGWLLIPIVLTYSVIGFAYIEEESKKT